MPDASKDIRAVLVAVLPLLVAQALSMSQLDARWTPLLWTVSAIGAVLLLALKSGVRNHLEKLWLLHPLLAYALAGISTVAVGLALLSAWPAAGPTSDSISAPQPHRVPTKAGEMPQRTNEKQEIIALLRRNLAREGCTVSESKMLTDVVTGARREVDVVMNCPEADVPVTISFEVLGHDKPADVTWVEQQQKKHERLPTNKLYLVSWSGFTAGAVAQAKTDPKIVLVTPEHVLGPDGLPTVRSLFTDEVSLSATKASFFVQHPEKGEMKVTDILPGHSIFDANGTAVGTAGELVSEFLHAPPALKEVLTGFHNHPEREHVKWFVLGVKPFPTPSLFLRWEATGELHPIIGLEVTGEFSGKQTKVDLTVMKFGDEVFGHARTELSTRTAMLVATLGEKETVKKLTTRVYAKGEEP